MPDQPSASNGAIEETTGLLPVVYEPPPEPVIATPPDFDVRGVYFIQQADDPDGLVKIGYATSIKERLAALQTGSPVELRIVSALGNAPPLVERRLHQRFAEHRVRGEWFRPVDTLRRLMNGEDDFLVALVTLGEVSRVLKVPQQFVATSEVADIGDPLGPKGGSRWWEEDIQRIARIVEEERIRQGVRKVLALYAKRSAQHLDEILDELRMAP